MSTAVKRSSPIAMFVKWFIVLAVLGGGGYAGWLYIPRGTETAVRQRASHTVTRSDLLITLTEGGTLQALKEEVIRNEVPGQSRITFLIDEGQQVKEGDLLLELDSSQLAEKLNSQLIEVQRATAAASSAEESLAIKRSQNESNIREAELKIEFAKLDLEKYTEGDYPQDLNKAEADITIAEAELTRSRDKLTWTERLQEQGYATRSELEADQLTVKRGELDLQQAKHKLDVLKRYEFRQQTAKLQAEVTKATEELERVRRRGAAEDSQAEADLASKKAQLELQQSKLEQIQSDLALCRITAPQDGLVIYNTGAGGNRRGQSGDFLEVGAMVNQRQELLKLPDLSRMKVDIKVHEARVGQIRPGLAVAITIDTLPDQVFQGRVTKVAVLPDAQSSWLNPDLKVYSTTVLIEDALPTSVKPGVSTKAQVIVAHLEDVISVPLQAVVTYDGDQFCFVHDSTGALTARPVQVGMYNEARIEITQGLEVGDVITLDPPQGADAIRKHVELVSADELERIRNAPEPHPAPVAAAPDKPEKTLRYPLPKDLLEAMPADRREKFEERWKGLNDEERRQLVEKLRARQSGGAQAEEGGGA